MLGVCLGLILFFLSGRAAAKIFLLCLRARLEEEKYFNHKKKKATDCPSEHFSALMLCNSAEIWSFRKR